MIDKFLIAAAFLVGSASGAMATWHSFSQPEIKRLADKNTDLQNSLDKERERSRKNAAREANRNAAANNAREANADVLRNCVYPDDLRMRLEALAESTRDDSRYKD